MLSTYTHSRTLLVMPLFVLMFTRLGIELYVHILPLHLSWIPSFITYYVSIEICLWFAKRRMNITVASRTNRILPLPKIRYLVFGVVLPAIIPLGVFISNYKAVPWSSYAYILVFASINPFFEEAFWRGLFINLSVSSWKRQLLSGLLFSFSHYFLWGAYWLSNPRVLIPTCITTFIMGWCWMWFYQRDRRLLYPILSHVAVDVLNLSIAVFMGLRLANT